MRFRLNHDRLLELIRESHLSQNHLAIKLGLSRGHWSGIVNGKHPYPSRKTRERLVELFTVPFDELFEMETGKSNPSFHTAISNRYAIDSEIGQGAMGTVYLARDVRLGRQVAIKAVSQEIVSGIGLKRFMNETRYTARLQHPHILPLYDTGEAAGQPFYVTPYLPDGSLRDLLEQKGPLSVEETHGILRGVGGALQFAHERRILHCDIKPGNVLLTGLHAYVADFGISRVVHSEVLEWGRSGDIDSSAGTPAYVSPEQASGEREIDARSDVYSLGCMVFEMLSGSPPFSGATTMQTVASRFGKEVPNLQSRAPHVPSAVALAVNRAMAFAPEHRHADVEQLVEDVERAKAGRDSIVVTVSRQFIKGFAKVGRSGGGGVRGTGGGSFGAKVIATVLGTFEDGKASLRTLAKRPAFSLLAILMLALGIGVNTATFSVAYGVLLKPLPYAESERLVEITRGGAASVPNFLNIRAETNTLDNLVATVVQPFVLTGTGDAQRVWGAAVSANFFGMLKEAPQLGRYFAESDEMPNSESVAVLSDRLWRERFNANPDVMGRSMTVNGTPVTIVGVTRPGFQFRGDVKFIRGDPQFWTTFRWVPGDLPNRRSRFLNLYGRLADGVELSAAEAEINSIFDRLKQDYPADNPQHWRVGVAPLRDYLTRGIGTPLAVLLGAAGLVLLIACANVANLALAKAESRRRELAVRAALGASRARLARLFVTESLLVTIAGGVTGVLAASWFLHIVVAAVGESLPRVGEIAVDGSVVAAAVCVTLFTGLIVGLVPAFATERSNLHNSLKEGDRGSARGASRFRSGLVIVEVALALMLVVGAGLLLRSFWNLYRTDLGIDGEKVLTASIRLNGAEYSDVASIGEFYSRLIGGVEALPFVERAAGTSMLPLGGINNITTLRVVGAPDTATFVERRWVSDGYFETMGIPLLRGRDFGRQEAVTPPKAVIINQMLARTLFGDGSALGRYIDPGEDEAEYEIVGVVGDVKVRGHTREAPPMTYFPWIGSPTLVVRTAGDPSGLAVSIRSVVRNIDPDVPVFDTARMSDLISGSFNDRRFVMWMLLVFAALALSLGTLGIYGVVSYTVAQRTREVGIRMALGATMNRVMGEVVFRGVRIVAIGVSLGVVATLTLRRAVGSMLFGVSPSDPFTFLAAGGAIISIGMLASWFPARRAALVNPTEALREE
jgi:predicted permease